MKAIIAILLMTLQIATAHAEECEPLAANLWENARAMGVVTRSFIQEIEQAEAKQGRPFTVGIIQRKGTDMSGVQLLRRVDQYGKPTSLDQFMNEITYVRDTSRMDAPREIYGPDLVKKYDSRKLEYSHVGLVFRNHPKAKPEIGEWVVIHLLDHCARNGDGPGIRTNSLNRFFADQLEEYKVKVVVPDVELQQALERVVLKQNFKSNKNMRSSKYNAASLWTSLTDENSNVWPLEMIAAALRPEGAVQNRADAIRVLKQEGYQGSLVQAKGKTALAGIGFIGKMFRVNLSEHPYARTYGIAEIATALSIDDFLHRSGHFAEEYEITVPELDPKPVSNQSAK